MKKHFYLSFLTLFLYVTNSFAQLTVNGDGSIDMLRDASYTEIANTGSNKRLVALGPNIYRPASYTGLSVALDTLPQGFNTAIYGSVTYVHSTSATGGQPTLQKVRGLNLQ